MFFTFPRRISIPQRYLVENLEQYHEFVNRYNGVVNLYIEIYKNNEIDKIFFDFDSPKALENVRKMHQWCKEKDYRHTILFSGRGFHVYIKATGLIKHPKIALSNVHTKIAEELGLLWGEPSIADLDCHVRGNISQVARIPYTINPRSGRNCCFLPEYLLSHSYEAICNYSEKPNRDPYYYGTKEIDLSKYDSDKEYDIHYKMKIPESNLQISGNFPDCIKSLLRNPELRYRERLQLILYLRANGFSKSEVISVLQKYLSEEKFHHCVKEEHQVDYLFRKEDEYFFNHQDLERMGYCKDENCSLKKFYKTWDDIL